MKNKSRLTVLALLLFHIKLFLTDYHAMKMYKSANRSGIHLNFSRRQFFGNSESIKSLPHKLELGINRSETGKIIYKFTPEETTKILHGLH